MIEMTVEQTKTGWLFFISENGEQIAELVADSHGERAVIHSEILRWSKKYMVIYREIFQDIRGYLRAKGFKLVIPCTDQPDPKIRKFWRLMGFRCFHEFSHQGKTIYLAVMEA